MGPCIAPVRALSRSKGRVVAQPSGVPDFLMVSAALRSLRGVVQLQGDVKRGVKERLLSLLEENRPFREQRESECPGYTYTVMKDRTASKSQCLLVRQCFF